MWETEPLLRFAGEVAVGRDRSLGTDAPPLRAISTRHSGESEAKPRFEIWVSPVSGISIDPSCHGKPWDRSGPPWFLCPGADDGSAKLAPAEVETPGCYKINTLDLDGAPHTLFWQIYEYHSLDRRRSKLPAPLVGGRPGAFARLVLSAVGYERANRRSGPKRGDRTSGSAGRSTTAHFAEAIVPPGMRGHAFMRIRARKPST